MIALDSSVIMCLVEGIEPGCTEAKLLMLRGKLACVSVDAITECMKKPIAERNTEEISLFDRFFRSEDCWLADVDIQVARRAAEISHDRSKGLRSMCREGRRAGHHPSTRV